VESMWKITFTANGYDFYFEVEATSEEEAREWGLNILPSAFPDEGDIYEITSVRKIN
jgi:hypothetical protein